MKPRSRLTAFQHVQLLAERSKEVPCRVEGLDPVCWVPAKARLDSYTSVAMSDGSQVAHRLAFSVLRDESFLSTDLVLDHLCFTKACWNPWHLDPVTQSVNRVRLPQPRRSLSRPSPDGFLNVRELEERGVSRSTLYRWFREGLVTRYKSGMQTLVNRSELDETLRPIRHRVPANGIR